jgi:NAD(P)-dependent dehydrogenase (short-subunit alcohol dehydrogenase family)
MNTNEHRKSVLVTGAGRGIGRAIALHLASRGWDVYAGVRDPEAGRALAAQCHRIAPVELDITVEAHVARLDELLPERLEAVVNNAGIAVGGPIETVSLDDVRRQLNVNVVGQVAVTQATMPRLRQSRGRLVFISSLNGRVSIPMSAIYNTSKFALEALADSLRVELRPWGVRVILVEPGCIDTDPWREMMSLLDGVAADMSPEERELYAPHLAGQRAVLAKLQAQTRPPEIVAAAVEQALTRRRPRSRMVIGNDARGLVALKTALPTPLMDAFWARGLRLPAPPRDGDGAATADFLVVERHNGETLAMTTPRSSSSSRH